MNEAKNLLFVASKKIGNEFSDAKWEKETSAAGGIEQALSFSRRLGSE